MKEHVLPEGPPTHPRPLLITKQPSPEGSLAHPHPPLHQGMTHWPAVQRTKSDRLIHASGSRFLAATVTGLASSSPGDLRITRVFSCVARRFKACASFMFAGCCWWRSLAVDGGSGTSRGHGPVMRGPGSRWSGAVSRPSAHDAWHLRALVLVTTLGPSTGPATAPCPAQTPPPNPTAAGPGDGRVLSRPSSRVHEPGTLTEAVALRSQTVLTGSGSHRSSYGGFGGGHPHFHLHAGPASTWRITSREGCNWGPSAHWRTMCSYPPGSLRSLLSLWSIPQCRWSARSTTGRR